MVESEMESRLEKQCCCYLPETFKFSKVFTISWQTHWRKDMKNLPCESCQPFLVRVTSLVQHRLSWIPQCWLFRPGWCVYQSLAALSAVLRSSYQLPSHMYTWWPTMYHKTNKLALVKKTIRRELEKSFTTTRTTRVICNKVQLILHAHYHWDP